MQDDTEWDAEFLSPTPCPAAFHEAGRRAEYSRAALLLALGIYMAYRSPDELYGLLESAPFELPDVAPLGSSKVRAGQVLRSLRNFDLELDSRTQSSEHLDAVARDLADELYGEGSQGSSILAARLIALHLFHPNALLAVAAAVSWFVIVDDPSLAVSVLVAAATSQDELVRAMALTAAHRTIAWPLSQSDLNPVEPRSPQSGKTTQVDSLLVHGTVFSPAGAPQHDWWTPNQGDLHEYLRRGTRPGVYSDPDFFRWSGGWNDYARYEAAHKLAGWLEVHDLERIDLIAHSHGANVAMRATGNQRLRKLVLLSCPVHWDLYRPDFRNVDKVLSIRTKWDFVIMCDRGGQRFYDSRIEEEILPIWFTGHNATHRPCIWRRHHLDKHL